MTLDSEEQRKMLLAIIDASGAHGPGFVHHCETIIALVIAIKQAPIKEEENGRPT